MNAPDPQSDPRDLPLDEHRELRRNFARSWHQAETRVQAFVFSMVPGFHDAEDLIQKIAEEAAVRFDEYDADRGPFEAWVIFWAKRRIIDHFRKVRRDRHVFDESLVEKIADAQIARAGTTDPRAEALEHCLDKLPPKSRGMLDRRYVDDQSPTQIASDLGSTPGSIRVQLCRIRDTLADCITRRVAKEESK